MSQQTAQLRASGIIYSATVERHKGRPRLVAVTMTASDGDDLVTADLMPLSLIAVRALAQLDADTVEGKPSAEQLARAYRDARAARDGRRPGEAQISIRAEVAARFRVPVARVDGWLKELRIAQPDLLPPAFTGRPKRAR